MLIWVESAMSFLIPHRKIAVTGSFGSGKSVFMLSLLQQLNEFDSRIFKLNSKRNQENIEIKKVSSLRIRNENEAFPYATLIQKLMKIGGGTWPHRSSALLRYRALLSRSDRLLPQELEFFSFPLERVIDLSLIKTPKYDDWSDQVLFKINEDQQAVRLARKYFQHLDSAEINPEHLITSYKHTLAQFIFEYKTFVAPSTFMIGLDGDRITGGSVESVSQGRFVGLGPLETDQPREFIPLSGIVRMRFPQLAEQMQKHFQIYQQQLTRPLFQEFNQSKVLVILIDIPALLAGGRSAFNEQLWLLDQLSFLLKRRKEGQLLGRNHVEKIAIIANKCDLIRPFEREARLPTLLHELTDEFALSLDPSIQIGRFLCSPCVATREHQDPERLVGRLMNNAQNSDRLEKVFDVPALPRHWPKDYAPRDFPFSKVWPPALRAHEKLPNHYHLDDVFRFIMD